MLAAPARNLNPACAGISNCIVNNLRKLRIRCLMATSDGRIVQHLSRHDIQIHATRSSSISFTLCVLVSSASVETSTRFKTSPSPPWKRKQPTGGITDRLTVKRFCVQFSDRFGQLCKRRYREIKYGGGGEVSARVAMSVGFFVKIRCSLGLRKITG